MLRGSLAMEFLYDSWKWLLALYKLVGVVGCDKLSLTKLRSVSKKFQEVKRFEWGTSIHPSPLGEGSAITLGPHAPEIIHDLESRSTSVESL